jgi:hypothetical protein
MLKKITIKTTPEKFYRQFLELFRSLPPFNELRSREVDVLSQIMYQNNKHSYIPIKTRSLVVFSTDVRKEMRSSLDISEDIFNNNLSGLRKRKLITEDNKLAPFLESILFNKEFALQFNFLYNE